MTILRYSIDPNNHYVVLARRDPVQLGHVEIVPTLQF